ncbi:MAG TPA: choice-of-anchor tandem repeat GloVer-containing protein [Verrucomicrobiae bacterium]|nr:choice-of-anchor tandem repeat GloVer-containing protein [Verrucomicrobiae bacterium]
MNVAKWFTVVVLLSAAVLGGASGQTLTTLYSFDGGTNGVGPDSGLVQGSDGSFYGTTSSGGTNTVCGDKAGCGTVFKITPQGTLTTLWQFGTSLTDGLTPYDGLVQGNDGGFYGTTLGGGTNYSGTIFKITPQGALTTLWQFGTSLTDGAEPRSGLVQGTDGDFYGTTQYGGTNYSGTIFKINPQGALTTLWQFSGKDGYSPSANLVQGRDGNFYGTTWQGGTNNEGTVFKISSQGTLTVLWQFGSRPTDGSLPYAGLVQGADGDLYGATEDGGSHGWGMVFKITSQGTLTTLWQLGDNSTDGRQPNGLLQGSDGNFYGATQVGGTNSDGTAFKITPQGTLTTLWQFNITDGFFPYAGLVQGSDGSFYGTTDQGGLTNSSAPYGRGTVFKISVPLNPPANQISSVQSDSSGTNLVFGIPSVAGETYQLQFTSDLASGIWTNVPSVSVTNSIGAMLTLTNFGGVVGPQGFYRFAITP